MATMARISLPVMQCDEGCGACCGIAPCHDHEFRAVEEYAREHGLVPLDQGVTCPWYQGGKCQVYPVRPWVCRYFGHIPGLKCERGYNVNVPEALQKRLDRRYGMPTRMLHEIIPGWLERTGKEIFRVADGSSQPHGADGPS